MKQGVLCVSVGSTVASARKELSWLECALSGVVPGALFRTAYSGERILHMLLQQGHAVSTPIQVMNDFICKGVQHVFVQPLYITYGREYQGLLQQLKDRRLHFQRLCCGQPLVTDEQSLLRLAGALAAHYPRQSNTSYIFVGHGTNTEANWIYEALQAVMQVCGRSDWIAATVQARPDFHDAVQQVKTSYAILVPMTLTAGRHILRDVAGEHSQSLRSKLAAKGVMVTVETCGLAGMPQVCEIFCDRLRQLWQGNATV